jgi:c-di-GMP-binding flagellar brake protein YcgR
MSEMSAQPGSVERRREKRVQVRLPVEIRGTDRSGKQFDERTTSENLCRGGVAFTLSRELDLGANLEINIPLPRAGQKGETDFATRGEVRHVYTTENGRIFGVAFTGPRFQRMFVSESATNA